MNGFTDFLGRVVSGIIKLVFGLALAVFVLSLLLAVLVVVLVVVLVASLWALVTGRKPAPVVMFNHFRQASQRYAGGAWPGRAGAANPTSRGAGRGDVVDVQAHEVPEPAAPGAAGAPRSGNDPMARMLP